MGLSSTLNYPLSPDFSTPWPYPGTLARTALLDPLHLPQNYQCLDNLRSQINLVLNKFEENSRVISLFFLHFALEIE